MSRTMAAVETRAQTRRVKAAARSSALSLKAYVRWAIRTPELDPTLRGDCRAWAQRKGLRLDGGAP